jgi:hypothetical protein
MPLYEVKGYGRDTSRKRSRVYSADNEDHLYQVAGDDGTIIESWALYEVEPEPPTAAQLTYAATLKIKLPTGVLTKAQVSDLIAEATGNTGHMQATSEQRKRLKSLGAWPDAGMTREEAEDRLSDIDTAMKWIYSVVRHYANLNWLDRSQTTYLDERVIEHAIELSQDKKLMEYIHEAAYGLSDHAFENACEDAGLELSDQQDEWYFFNADGCPTSRSKAYKWVAERVKINVVDEKPASAPPKAKQSSTPVPTHSSDFALSDVLFPIMVIITIVAFFAGMASASGTDAGVQFATGLGYALLPGLLTGLLKVTSWF